MIIFPKDYDKKLDFNDIKLFWDNKFKEIGRDTVGHYDFINNFKEGNLLTYFKNTVKSRPNAIAADVLGRKTSFKELDSLSDRLATYFLKIGLSSGDKVGLMLPNSLQFVVSVFAILKAGLILVPLNPLYTQNELGKIMESSGIKLLIGIDIMSKEFIGAINENSHKLKHLMITSLGDGLLKPKGILIDLIISKVKKMVPKNYCLSIDKLKNKVNVFEYKKATEYYEFFATEKLSNIHRSIKNEDIVLISYTGGTTGLPKGCPLTHRNLISDIIGVFHCFPESHMNNAINLLNQGVPVYAYLPLPMYHLYTLLGVYGYIGVVGLTLLTLPNPREIKEGINLLSKKNIAVLPCIDTLIKAYSNTQDKKSKKILSNLTKTSPFLNVTGGGMTTSRTTVEAFKKATGITVVGGYGQTEASPIVTWDDHIKPVIGSVGFPIGCNYIKLSKTNYDIEDTREDIPLGAGSDFQGEILVKGDNVFSGYLNSKENVLTKDGWLKTGDIGYIDNAGRIFITDRVKDLIIVSGFNVYPSELESFIQSKNIVSEVAAIGRKDESGNEKIIIYITPKAGEASLDAVSEQKLKIEVANLIKSNFVNYKHPSEVIVRKELPKNPIGKILKKDLK